jgi:hypothetical protein
VEDKGGQLFKADGVAPRVEDERSTLLSEMKVTIAAISLCPNNAVKRKKIKKI